MFALRPIRTKDDYTAALTEMARLWGAEAGSADCERLEVLATLAGAYEDAVAPIDPPDTVDALAFALDQGRMTRNDLNRIAGSAARADDILARRRRPTLAMIWDLHSQFGIPLASLARPYKLAVAPRVRRPSHPTTGSRSA